MSFKTHTTTTIHHRDNGNRSLGPNVAMASSKSIPGRWSQMIKSIFFSLQGHMFNRFHPNFSEIIERKTIVIGKINAFKKEEIP
jgi:hypothetical protein